MSIPEIIHIIIAISHLGMGIVLLGLSLWGFYTIPDFRTYIEMDDEERPLKIMLIAVGLLGVLFIYLGVAYNVNVIR